MDETTDTTDETTDQCRKSSDRHVGAVVKSSGIFSIDGATDATDEPTGEPKKFHDKRLDSVTKPLNIFSHQEKLNVIRKATGLGLDHLDRGTNRFQSHAMQGGTNVTSSSRTGLVQGKKSLLDSSLRNVSTIKRRPEDTRTGFGKRMEKIRQEALKKT